MSSLFPSDDDDDEDFLSGEFDTAVMVSTLHTILILLQRTLCISFQKISVPVADAPYSAVATHAMDWACDNLYV